jgi:hypothetical protein
MVSRVIFSMTLGYDKEFFALIRFNKKGIISQYLQLFENIFFLGVHVFERTYDRDELIRLIGVRQRHTEQSLEASQKFFCRRTGFLGYL